MVTLLFTVNKTPTGTVMFDRVAIGKRIVEARQARGLNSPAALAKAMQEIISRQPDQTKHNGGKKPRRTLSRQTVENWEKGRNVPPLERVEIMVRVFKPEHNEAWIMFGDRREAQIARERRLLVYLNDEESELMNEFRHANEAGRKAIMANAKTMAKAFPIPIAEIHPMRRRGEPESKNTA